jgi:hypothetical protein
MDLNIGRELAALQRLTVKQLRERYAEVFGEPTNANNKAWLIKRIAWRLQALAEGDLSQRARQRAAELANDADLRLSPPRVPQPVQIATVRNETATLRLVHDDRVPTAGTVITRKYKGEVLQVKVLTSGFEYGGQVYPSLSAVAKVITGSHCNGFAFFKLGDKGDGQ